MMGERRITMKETDVPPDVDLSSLRVVMLGTFLLLIAMIGFYFIPGMIVEEAGGSRLVNSFYCAVMTLTTVGFGDICPGNISVFGKAFISSLCFSSLGLFCGPIMDLAASWRHSVPSGMIAVTLFTVAIGVAVFTISEEMFYSEAIYLSIITGTTVGYGDLAPQSDVGKILVAIYALFAVNVVGALLEPAKEYLLAFCHVAKTKTKASLSEKKRELKKKIYLIYIYIPLSNFFEK